ncbi:hypothetical protein BVAD3_13870 [Bacillus velezensis]|nr:hypothetical protein BVAD3_13870 [Bacillus velezensis]
MLSPASLSLSDYTQLYQHHKCLDEGKKEAVWQQFKIKGENFLRSLFRPVN